MHHIQIQIIPISLAIVNPVLHFRIASTLSYGEHVARNAVQILHLSQKVCVP